MGIFQLNETTLPVYTNYHKGLLNFSEKDVNIMLKLTLNLSSVLVFESTEWYKKGRENKQSTQPYFDHYLIKL